MVQRAVLTAEEAGAAVTLMLAIGIVCAALLAGLSAPLAGAVRMDGLSAVLAALSVSVVLSIAALGPRALLERSLRYQVIALVETAAAAAAAVICVSGAVAGWGIWALVAYYVSVQLFRAVAFATLARRQLRLNLHWHRVPSILTFGGWVLASNIFNFAARNIGNLLIGAKLGAAAVGLFGLAYIFMTLPLMVFSWPGGAVLMATLSRMTGEGRRAQQSGAICGVIGMTAMITFPAMFYLTFGLTYPVRTFLSPHWADVVPLIAVLAPAGVAQSIAAYSGPILLARGEARLQFCISSANSLSMILAFAVALPFGLMAVVIVYVVVAIIVCILMLMIGARRVGLAYAPLVESLVPASIATAAGTAGALAATMGDVTTLKTWLLASIVYAVIVLTCYIAFRRQISGSLQSLLGRPMAEFPTLDLPTAS
jgi:O-antigen/teichoic acid export membrane protein